MGSLPGPGIEPVCPALQCGFLTTRLLRESPEQFSVQFSSVAQSCLTLCDPMNHSTPGLPITNSQSSSKLMPTESVMPTNHLLLCSPLLLLPSIFPSTWVFSNVSTLCSCGMNTVAIYTLVFYKCFVMWLFNLPTIQSCEDHMSSCI